MAGAALAAPSEGDGAAWPSACEGGPAVPRIYQPRV